MKIKEEHVEPSKFKKRLDIQGVPDLQTALNVLRLYQEWRTGMCIKDIDELGITPSIITAALHYVLGKFHANKPLYKCEFCSHNDGIYNCNIESKPFCKYKPERRKQ